MTAGIESTATRAELAKVRGLDQDIHWSAEEVHATFRRVATQGVKRFATTA